MWTVSFSFLFFLPAHSIAQLSVNGVEYGFYQSGYDYSLIQWDKLTHAVDFDFPLNSNGTLNASPQTDFISAAESNCVRPIMCVYSFDPSVMHSVLSNPAFYQNVITQILKDFKTYGYQGVNIDFEGMYSSDKTNFTNFITDLADQVYSNNSNYEVTCAGGGYDGGSNGTSPFDLFSVASATDGWLTPEFSSSCPLSAFARVSLYFVKAIEGKPRAMAAVECHRATVDVRRSDGRTGCGCLFDEAFA